MAHRGASRSAPENTLSSFEHGLELGAQWLELDVHLSKDGQLMVIHDPSVDRTTSGHGRVNDLTRQEIQLLNIGTDERVPALDEVLDRFSGRASFNIEIKDEATTDLLGQMLKERLDNKTLRPEDVLVSSFLHPTLVRIKEIDRRINTAPLIGHAPADGGNFAVSMDAYSVNIRADFLTETFTKAAHENGLKVYVWTVNDPEGMRRAVRLGADGIITDAMDVAVNTVRCL